MFQARIMRNRLQRDLLPRLLARDFDSLGWDLLKLKLTVTLKSTLKLSLSARLVQTSTGTMIGNHPSLILRLLRSADLVYALFEAGQRSLSLSHGASSPGWRVQPLAGSSWGASNKRNVEIDTLMNGFGCCLIIKRFSAEEGCGTSREGAKVRSKKNGLTLS